MSNKTSTTKTSITNTMFTSKGVEHFDIFSGEIVFWCNAGNVTEQLIEKAKEIDGKEFSTECFGCCVSLDEDGWNFLQESVYNDNTIYYIDNNGEKHWIGKIPHESKKAFINDCIRSLKKASPENASY